MAEFEVLLEEAAPSFYMVCKNCYHKFWIDAATEENLIRIRNKKGQIELVEKCPSCKEIRSN